MARKRPLLKWKLEDYLIHEIDPPEVLLANSLHTEGELMTENEIATWISDNYKTLVVLKDAEDEEIFKEIRNNFLEDLEYLYKIKKILNAEITGIIKDDIFN